MTYLKNMMCMYALALLVTACGGGGGSETPVSFSAKLKLGWIIIVVKTASLQRNPDFNIKSTPPPQTRTLWDMQVIKRSPCIMKAN